MSYIKKQIKIPRRKWMFLDMYPVHKKFGVTQGFFGPFVRSRGLKIGRKIGGGGGYIAIEQSPNIPKQTKI